jgi:hypothetical protein
MRLNSFWDLLIFYLRNVLFIITFILRRFLSNILWFISFYVVIVRHWNLPYRNLWSLLFDLIFFFFFLLSLLFFFLIFILLIAYNFK